MNMRDSDLSRWKLNINIVTCTYWDTTAVDNAAENKQTTLEKYVQQNSFHLSSNNSEILIVQHFQEGSTKTKNFAFHQKKKKA